MRNKRPKNPNRIDKSELAVPVSPRMEDRAVLDLIREQDCMVCGDSPCDPAHIRTGHTGGTSRKPDDNLVLPLCHTHHMAQEANIGARWWIENVLQVQFVGQRGDSHDLVEDVLLKDALYPMARELFDILREKIDE